MKLLFAIKQLDSAMGGAERVLCEVCSELAKRGHNITIVTFDEIGGQPFYQLDDRINKINLGIGKSSRSARGGETIHRIIRLRNIIKNERPQVVVGFMHSMFVLLAFAMIGTGIPVIGSEHIVPEHYRKRPIQYLLLILSSYFMSQITVLSEQIRKRYPKPLRVKMVDMPNPVMTTPTTVNHASIKPKYTILNIGRLDPQKDQETLIRAFSHIADAYPEWELKIIGEGELQSRLDKIINDLGLDGRVRLQGVTQNIGTEYSTADVFAMSSRYEAFGLVTAEAMSYGLPVVGFSDCPGTNELIQNNITGFLVNENSDRAKSLARALDKLLSNAELREQFGQAGKNEIDDRYSIQCVGDLWENLLKQYSNNNINLG